MKSKILKLIFILSFIPYIFVLFGICVGIIGFVTGLTDLEVMLQTTFDYSVIIPIVPACLTFQLCYIFRKKRTVMFMCLFIPWIFMLLVAVKEAVPDITYMNTVYYGLEAFDIVLFSVFQFYTYYPILQICFIFQIVLIILAIIKKKKAKTEIQNT